MRRALAALALLALPALAEDAGSLCAQLQSESPKERAAAVEALRKAGPEADAALARAAGEGVDLARSIREARRWDPEARIADVDAFGDLSSPEPQKRQASFGRLVGMGSTVSGSTVRRILDACAPADRAGLVRCLGYGPGRDRGWAREAALEIRSPAEDVRLAAAQALASHGGREQWGDLRLALERETSRTNRTQLWQSLISNAGGPEELPALPADPEEFTAVLEWMAEAPSADIRTAAWRAFESRRPGTIPQPFWNEPARLIHVMGTGAYLAAMPAGGQMRQLPLNLRAQLSESSSPQARSSAAVNDEYSPLEIARVCRFLSDPDFSVRQGALAALERWDRTNEQKPEWERRDNMARMGAAARAFLDGATGAADSREFEWAVRALLDAGQDSTSAATLAYQSFWICREKACERLRELEADKELGSAAKRVRRLLTFAVAPGGVGFGRGLDSTPRVRSVTSGSLDLEAWRELARSEDAEEKQLAVALLGDAWDRLDLREEIVAEIRKLAEGQDASTSQVATAFLASQAPDQLPDREEIDYRDAWVRSRPYVLARLRASLAPAVVLDRQKASMIQAHGDRSLLLAAVRAGRFDQPSTEWALTLQGSEPGLLPILVSRLADMETTSTPQSLGALANCSPQGARMVAAMAREADPKIRPTALGALMTRPWADSLSEPIAEALAASAVAEDRKILLDALRTFAGRNRAPCTTRLADAIASLLLGLSAEGNSRADLEVLVPAMGESLSRASEKSLTALAKDPVISSIARNYGTDFSPARSPEEQLFAGDRNTRYRAMSRLQPRSLKSARLVMLSWLTCGNLNEASEIWILQRSGDFADLALLSFAADEPLWCDELLRLRRLVRRWYYTPPPASPPSIRLMDGEPPPEFDGNSIQKRVRAIGTVWTRESPHGFFSVCAAAFRGSPGDEVALQSVLPRLGPDALPRLVPLLNARLPGVRQSAAKAIGRLGAESPRFAAAALRASLEGETHRAARSAKLGALARLNDPAGLEAIRNQASSPEADDRLAAARALDSAPSAAVAEMLASLAADPDYPVREAAHAALQRMTRREYPPDLAPWETRDWKAWLKAHPETEFRIEE